MFRTLATLLLSGAITISYSLFSAWLYDIVKRRFGRKPTVPKTDA